MALQTLSDLLRLLRDRGGDAVAALVFLLLAAEHRARYEWAEFKRALYVGYAWGQAFSGWGL